VHKIVSGSVTMTSGRRLYI